VNDTGVTTPVGVAKIFDPRLNDTDTEDSPTALAIVSASGAGHGSVTFTSASVTYTPTAGYYGADTISYTIRDTSLATASATVSLTVMAPPTASGEAITTASNTATAASYIDFDPRGNDSDPEGGMLTLSVAANQTNGTATVLTYGTSSDDDDKIRFTPTVNFIGAASYNYTVTDPQGLTATATVAVTVTNRAPVAVGEWINSLPGQTMTYDVRSNDSDPEGFPTRISYVSAPDHGTAEVTGDGLQITYMQPVDYSGTASFTYKIMDVRPSGATWTEMESAPATVNVNAPPIAVADTATTLSSSPVTLDPRSNDWGPTGETLTTLSVQSVTNGTAVINANGTVTFTPTASFIGTGSFAYTVRDSRMMTASSTVTVTVQNRAPVANNDAATTLSSAAVTTSVLGNDSDPESGALTLLSVQSATNGSAAISGSSVIFTPTTNFVGAASYTYTIRDPHNATATATVNVTVQNRAPVAVADSTSTVKNTALTYNPRGNDSDPEGGALTITSVASAANGSASVSGGGTTVTFTPTTNFTGTASYSYTIQDPNGGSASASVTIDVTPPPVSVTNPSRTVASSTSSTFTLADLATVTGASTIQSFTPSEGSANIAGGAQSATFNAPSNNVSYCDAGTVGPLSLTIPYVIRHTSSGVDYGGTVSVSVPENIFGNPPKGGCP